MCGLGRVRHSIMSPRQTEFNILPTAASSIREPGGFTVGTLLRTKRLPFTYPSFDAFVCFSCQRREASVSVHWSPISPVGQRVPVDRWRWHVAMAGSGYPVLPIYGRNRSGYNRACDVVMA
jgi:hypothetical protein